MLSEVISEALAESLGTMLGEAILFQIPQTNSRTGKYKVCGDTAIFRVHTVITILGAVSAACAIVSVFIPDLFAKLLLAILFGALGLPLLLFGLVTRLTISPKEIGYRNLLGVKRQIMWPEVRSVSVKRLGDILICSQHVKIPVYAQFQGTKYIRTLLRSYSPGFASPSSDTVPSSKKYKLRVRNILPSKDSQA